MAARLAQLSPSDARIERTRLLGSPVAAGLADLVLRMEAERGVPVVDRRLEERFDGVFELLGTDGARRLPIRGVVDRIDLLADGALRVIDYKSTVPPAALQLAIYAVTAAQRLQGHRGRCWTVGEVSYVVFNGARVRPVGRNADDRGRALADAQLRFVAAADAIHAGAFPPRPAVEHLARVHAPAYAGWIMSPSPRTPTPRLPFDDVRSRRICPTPRTRSGGRPHAERRARGVRRNRQDARARGPLHEPARSRRRSGEHPRNHVHPQGGGGNA